MDPFRIRAFMASKYFDSQYPKSRLSYDFRRHLPQLVLLATSHRTLRILLPSVAPASHSCHSIVLEKFENSNHLVCHHSPTCCLPMIPHQRNQTTNNAFWTSLCTAISWDACRPPASDFVWPEACRRRLLLAGNQFRGYR